MLIRKKILKKIRKKLKHTHTHKPYYTGKCPPSMKTSIYWVMGEQSRVWKKKVVSVCV